MDNLTLNRIALTVLVVIGGLIFILMRRRQTTNEQKIIQMAAEHGWSYDVGDSAARS